MSITTAQIRGARGILNWSQSDLSAATNISTTSIGAIENGNTKPREITLKNIRSAFEKLGIEFIDGGVRHKKNIVDILEGEDCYLRLLDDVFHSLMRSEDRELLISCGDDRISPPAVNDSYRRMRRAGIKMRQLAEAGNHYLMGPLSEYRYLPQEYFMNKVSIIYGNKFAIVHRKGEKKITIIDDQALAENQRKLFNFIWAVTEQPDFSDATEKF